MKDFKHTLNMPTTDFQMKANLGQREPQFQEEWDKKKIYFKRLEKNKGNKQFILHDGPPYANGEIHVGHAFNKILKDFIVRYHNMRGFYSPYIPGWDTHGLPIETELTKKGVKRKEIPVAEFRKLCHEFALKQIDIQRKGFKRLGSLGDYNNPYLTLNKSFEADQIRVLGKMSKLGLVFKSLKPVYWSPTSESALAEAEIEYHDVVSNSIYVAMEVVDSSEHENTYLVIWTTTPWTIPGNLAISANETFEYSKVYFNNKNFIIASELLKTVLEKFNVTDYKLISKIKGNELANLKYKHPLYDRISPVLLGSHVTIDAGTGLVHTAPGHGEDDFNIGKANNLEIFSVVDEKGMMTEESGKYKGVYYSKANDLVINDLKEVNALLLQENITHSYPHDWRTKKPIIFRATLQWFVNLEPIKENILSEINNIKSFPKWGTLRLTNMFKDRKEWCISRQRAWGVPIPAFYTENNDIIMDEEVIEHVAKLFEEYGSNIWYEKEAKDLLPKGFTHKGSPNNIFYKEMDIMDVWFDSGSSFQILPKLGLNFPADVYLEGSDQYRGWFNSSLSISTAVNKKAPYKNLISHGFALDQNGRKMSKSQGNGVDPNKVMNQSGADILRLWAASVDYQQDVRIGDEILKQISEIYRKIRNTFKFILGSLNKFDEKNLLKYNDLNEIDKYILIKLEKLNEQVINSYNNFDFQNVYKLISTFMINDLSAFYLDFIKDIIYIESNDNHDRLSVETVLYHVINKLLVLLSPIIPHTTYEAYNHLNYKKEDDVFLENINDSIVYENSKEIEEKYDEFLKLRTHILKALEDARNEKIIGKSMNAMLKIHPTKEIKKLLDSLNTNLKTVLIVADLKICEVSDKLKIEVTKKDGLTCARCWQIVDKVDEDELCPRCRKVVNKFEHSNS